MSEQPGRDSILEKHASEFEKDVEVYNKKRDEAVKLLAEETLHTVETLIELRDMGSKEEIRLGAARYMAKLQGLEVERHEATLRGGLAIQITKERADLIASIGKLKR